MLLPRASDLHHKASWISPLPTASVSLLSQWHQQGSRWVPKFPEKICHPLFPSSKRPFGQPAVQKQPRPLPETLLPHGAMGRELQQRPPALLPMRPAMLGWTPAPRGDQPSDPAITAVRRICSPTPPDLHLQLSLPIANKTVGFVCPSGFRAQQCFPLRWNIQPHALGLMVFEMHWGT